VELVAVPRNATRVQAACGLARLDPERDVRLSLAEVVPRIKLH
jgi:hypothetical protein